MVNPVALGTKLLARALVPLVVIRLRVTALTSLSSVLGSTSFSALGIPIVNAWPTY